MGREIKFRIRDKKDMLFFDDLREMDFSDYCDFNKLMDRILPLMQYTWLKDKHWKEIYEGDIYEFNSFYRTNIWNWEEVINTNFVGEIIFHSWWFSWKIIKCSWDKIDWMYAEAHKYWQNEKIWSVLFLNIDPPNYTFQDNIIWNIYENPDLLPKTEDE